MRWQLAIRVAFLFPLFVAQQAMGDDSLPWVFNAPAADGYSIALNSVDPAPGTRLLRGSEVTITASITYKLSIADHGLVVLVLQHEKNRPVSPDGKSVSQEVAAPEGTLVLKQTLTVPRKAKEIRLFINLVPDGLETTTGEITIR
jgi:hypothetical protein